MDNFATAERLRGRAAACRALADMAGDEEARNEYLHAAELYEDIATQLEVGARQSEGGAVHHRAKRH